LEERREDYYENVAMKSQITFLNARGDPRGKGKTEIFLRLLFPNTLAPREGPTEKDWRNSTAKKTIFSID